MIIRGIVFDKDGTLFQYAGTWAHWCDSVLDRLSADDGVLKARLAATVGFDMATGDFLPGSLIVGGSAGEVNEAWATHLPDWSVDRIDAVAVEALATLPTLPVCDLPVLFSELTARGIRLGIATNDYEASAKMQLKDAGIAGFFSFVCGFDSGYGAKPGPGMIDGFCAATGLPAAEVAMVGDSIHDLGAGRAAQVGMNVGVLTGPAGREDIAHMADHILADIGALPGLLDRLAWNRAAAAGSRPSRPGDLADGRTPHEDPGVQAATRYHETGTGLPVRQFGPARFRLFSG